MSNKGKKIIIDIKYIKRKGKLFILTCEEEFIKLNIWLHLPQ